MKEALTQLGGKGGGKPTTAQVRGDAACAAGTTPVAMPGQQGVLVQPVSSRCTAAIKQAPQPLPNCQVLSSCHSIAGLRPRRHQGG